MQSLRLVKPLHRHLRSVLLKICDGRVQTTSFSMDLHCFFGRWIQSKIPDRSGSQKLLNVEPLGGLFFIDIYVETASV